MSPLFLRKLHVCPQVLSWQSMVICHGPGSFASGRQCFMWMNSYSRAAHLRRFSTGEGRGVNCLNFAEGEPDTPELVMKHQSISCKLSLDRWWVWFSVGGYNKYFLDRFGVFNIFSWLEPPTFSMFNSSFCALQQVYIYMYHIVYLYNRWYIYIIHISSKEV